MWKGLMKCPLGGHSSKWDRQAVQIYEKIRMERKGERERKAHPNPCHCHLLPGPPQVASYCGINRTRTSPDSALCQSLNSSLADFTRLTSWYIDLAFTQSLRPTDPSQLSLRFPESSFQPLAPCIYWSLYPECSCPEFPGPPFYHLSIFFMDLFKASFLGFIIQHSSHHHLAFLCVFVSLVFPSVRINLIILVSYIIYRIPFTRA